MAVAQICTMVHVEGSRPPMCSCAAQCCIPCECCRVGEVPAWRPCLFERSLMWVLWEPWVREQCGLQVTWQWCASATSFWE